MGKTLEVALQELSFASGTDGRTIRIDVQDEDGGAVRLYLDATTVPALVSGLLDAANATMRNLAEEELASLMAAELNRNIMNPIMVISAKAISGNKETQLMLHLGATVLQFRMPTAAARELARQVLA